MKAIFGRADRSDPKAGRGGGPVADLIRQAGISEQTFYRLEEAVRWAGGRPGPSAAASAGRKRAFEAADGGADPGQDDAAGRAGKKL